MRKLLPLVLVLVGCQRTEQTRSAPTTYGKAAKEFILMFQREYSEISDKLHPYLRDYKQLEKESQTRVLPAEERNRFKQLATSISELGPRGLTFRNDFSEVRTRGEMIVFLQKYYAYELGVALKQSQHEAYQLQRETGRRVSPRVVYEQVPANLERSIVDAMMVLHEEYGRDELVLPPSEK